MGPKVRWFVTCGALLALPLATRRVFAQQSPTTPAGATLTGFVHDSTGAPIENAEIIVRDTQLGARTNAAGEFKLANVPAGSHIVWFRRLGYASIEYRWIAEPGATTDLSIALQPVPSTLDPVVVREREDKRASMHSAIAGLILNEDGSPIADAEVQIVGANLVGMTRESGGFLFRSLEAGSYVVRARKIGYAPSVHMVQLVDEDDREVNLVLRRLPAELDPVTVVARSGYGNVEAPWRELEQRKRWVGGRAVFLGPEDLKAYGSRALDFVGAANGVGTLGGAVANPIPVAGVENSAWHDFNVPGEVCVLLNGRDGKRMSLSTFSARDVDLLEIYPGGAFSADATNTVAQHFHDPQCRPSAPMAPTPTYWVVWLKP